MKLHNVGHGVYGIGDTGWTVQKDEWNSTPIWSVFDGNGTEQFHRTTRKEAVAVAVGVLAEPGAGIGDTDGK